MKTIYIKHQPVELYKILKFENLVYGGGEAKMAISGGYVLLNGEVETQKRKKIVSGDIIGFDNECYQVVLEQPSEPVNSQSSTAPPKTKPRRSAIKFG